MCLVPRIIGLVATTLAFSAAVVTAADVTQLKTALVAGSAADQHSAADALADLGPAAREAVPELIAAIRSSDVDLRWRAARALGLIGDVQAFAALRTAASDEETLVRAQAIFALGRLKAGDAESTQAVVGHLSDNDAQVRPRTHGRAVRAQIQTPRQRRLHTRRPRSPGPRRRLALLTPRQDPLRETRDTRRSTIEDE